MDQKLLCLQSTYIHIHFLRFTCPLGLSTLSRTYHATLFGGRYKNSHSWSLIPSVSRSGRKTTLSSPLPSRNGSFVLLFKNLSWHFHTAARIRGASLLKETLNCKLVMQHSRDIWFIRIPVFPLYALHKNYLFSQFLRA